MTSPEMVKFVVGAGLGGAAIYGLVRWRTSRLRLRPKATPHEQMILDAASAEKTVNARHMAAAAKADAARS